MSDPLLNDPSPNASRGSLPPFASSDEKTMPIVVYVLYLLGFVTGGLTAVGGVIMAYVLRGGAGPMAASHYDFLIRTFWISLAGMLAAGVLFALGLLLLIVLIGIPILLLAKLALAVVAIWYGVRCVVGLIRVAQDEPYATPRSWML